MPIDCDSDHLEGEGIDLTRRRLIQAAAIGTAALILPGTGVACASSSGEIVDREDRFPHFLVSPVSYLQVRMQDQFWAPRQKVIRDTTVAWASAHWDEAGGLRNYRADPAGYETRIRKGDLEAIKFIEAMASVVGIERDESIEGLVRTWGQKMMEGQEPGGYWPFGWPIGADPARRWQAVWWSHEDYALGHYLESAIAFREVTGDDAMYTSAIRAIDNMAQTFLSSNRAYAPGHEEIEQALMRLYGLTGEKRYLDLCGWLIAQRGRHEGRRSYGRYSQDHVPIEQQRTIEGHAVRAAFLFNGVTQYVGATGDAHYREAVLAIWEDFVNHKMYLHGAGGNDSANNEGYRSEPDAIPPDDCYGESCSVFGNFQWAHSLFQLTGDAKYLDTAERMLYNAFYASLDLRGDRYFYRNLVHRDEPTLRFAWHPVPCCPPNIVKLFSKVGGFFYSTDREGIFVNHYGASEATIPFRSGLKLVQKTEYPWNGQIKIEVTPTAEIDCAIRLRVPAWAGGHQLTVNAEHVTGQVDRGWLTIRRKWKAGDVVQLNLPMTARRTTMPLRFKGYEDLVAIERGPVVYCLEEQDAPASADELYIPAQAEFRERRDANLGGATVLEASLSRVNFMDGSESPVAAVLVPYGVWNNRTPGAMDIWLAGRKRDLSKMLPSVDPPGEA